MSLFFIFIYLFGDSILQTRLALLVFQASKGTRDSESRESSQSEDLLGEANDRSVVFCQSQFFEEAGSSERIVVPESCDVTPFKDAAGASDEGEVLGKEEEGK